MIDTGTGPPGLVIAGTADVTWAPCDDTACGAPTVRTIASDSVDLEGPIDVVSGNTALMPRS